MADLQSVSMQVDLTVFDKLKVSDERGELWSARALMKVLGWTNWRNFRKHVLSAREACRITYGNQDLHFFDTCIKVSEGGVKVSEGQRGPVAEDWLLTRHACRMVVMACPGDTKPMVALAQTYFSMQTEFAERVQAAAGVAPVEVSAPAGEDDVLQQAELTLRSSRETTKALELAVATRRDHLTLAGEVQADRAALVKVAGRVQALEELPKPTVILKTTPLFTVPEGEPGSLTLTEQIRMLIENAGSNLAYANFPERWDDYRGPYIEAMYHALWEFTVKKCHFRPQACLEHYYKLHPGSKKRVSVLQAVAWCDEKYGTRQVAAMHNLVIYQCEDLKQWVRDYWTVQPRVRKKNDPCDIPEPTGIGPTNPIGMMAEEAINATFTEEYKEK
jgi:hypothetical protein